MYETIPDIITAHHVYCALRVALLGIAIVMLLCGTLAYHMYENRDNDKSGKVSLVITIFFSLLMLASGVAVQFYPNADEARAMIEEHALRNGTDAAPYIKIIDNAR